jgi:hypothetical protein
MDHLVETERPWVRRKLRAAWSNPDAGQAEAALRALPAQLDKVNPDASASLREGLTETLTVTAWVSPAACSRRSWEPTRSSP